MKFFSACALVHLSFMLAIVSCGGKGAVEECRLPAEHPMPVNLPEGGELILYQEANGEISESETDMFTIRLDCRPGYGFMIYVKISGLSEMDVAFTADFAGHHFESNQWGPGSGEGSTIVTALAELSLPQDLTVGIYSANGKPDAYEISVTPNPMPTE